jgi:hypothetical protein
MSIAAMARRVGVHPGGLAVFKSYRASGKISPRFLGLAAVAATVMCGLGWLHGVMLATGKGRPIGTSFVFVILIAGCITCYAALSLGKCRNRLLGVVACVMFGLLALGASHAVHYTRAPNGAVTGTSVVAWFEAQAAAGVPMPGARRGTLQGWGAWVRWGIELALVIGFFGYVGADTPKTPFCEGCGTDHDEQKRVCEWPSPSVSLVEVARACGSVAELAVPSPRDGVPATQWLVLVGRSCRCGELQTLTMVHERTTTSLDKKGEGSSKRYRTSDVLRENVVMDDDDVARFRLICEMLEGEVGQGTERA